MEAFKVDKDSDVLSEEDVYNHWDLVEAADKKEIQQGYEKYEGKIISDEEIDEIFAQIDVDGSGYIDYTEFVASAMDM